jgi:hypothetical protein
VGKVSGKSAEKVRTDGWGRTVGVRGRGKIGAWIGDKVWKNAEQDGTGGGQAAEAGAAELAILEVGRPAARCDGAAAPGSLAAG